MFILRLAKTDFNQVFQVLVGELWKQWLPALLAWGPMASNSIYKERSDVQRHKSDLGFRFDWASCC
jgi:hypothetical protein